MLGFLSVSLERFRENGARVQTRQDPSVRHSRTIASSLWLSFALQPCSRCACVGCARGLLISVLSRVPAVAKLPAQRQASRRAAGPPNLNGRPADAARLSWGPRPLKVKAQERKPNLDNRQHRRRWRVPIGAERPTQKFCCQFPSNIVRTSGKRFSRRSTFFFL